MRMLAGIGALGLAVLLEPAAAALASATDSRDWGNPQDGPAFLRDLAEELRRTEPVDPRRLSLFGHSAGARFALQMACLDCYLSAKTINRAAWEFLSKRALPEDPKHTPHRDPR